MIKISIGLFLLYILKDKFNWIIKKYIEYDYFRINMHIKLIFI
jgi:hypothetical protein